MHDSDSSDDDDHGRLLGSGSFNSFASTQMFASRLAELEDDDNDTCDMCCGGRLRCCTRTPKRRYGFGTCLVVLSVLCLVGGPLLSDWVHSITVQQVRDQAVVDSFNSPGYAQWVINNQTDAVPLYLNFYFFNLTNHELVRTAGAKPVYKELGPYCFRKYRYRFNMTFYDQGNRVRYWRKRWYIFDAERSQKLSGMPLDAERDIIVNVNPIYQGALAQAGSEVQLTVALVAPFIQQHLTLFQQRVLPIAVARRTPSTLAPVLTNLTALIQATLGLDATQAWEHLVTQWANATSPTPASPLWDHMHLAAVNGGVASGISVEAASRLLNKGVAQSIMSATYADSQGWYNASQEGNAGSLATRVQLAGEFGLSRAQVDVVAAWLRDVQVNVVIKSLLDAYGLKASEVDRLGYMQWSMGNVTVPAYASAPSLLPDLPNKHKYSMAVWAHSLFIPRSDYSLSARATMKLLTGPWAITVPTNLGDFVAAKLAKDDHLIMEKWGISHNQSTVLSAYITYMTGEFAEPYLKYVAFPAGEGIMSWRTPNQLLWGYENKLAGMLDPSMAFVQFQYNDTTEESVKKHAGLNDYWTGKDDIEKAMQFYKWHNMTQLEGVWAEPEVIKGTDGQTFRPFLNATDPVYVWEADLYRSLIMQPVGDVSYLGVKMQRYGIDNRTFVPSTRYYSHFPGFANMSGVNFGAPVFYSKPHFLDCDTKWLDKVDGITAPSREGHDTWLDVEPFSGITMHAHKRFGANSYIAEGDTTLNLYNGEITKGLMYPLFWLDENGMITQALADKFHLLYILFAAEKVLFYAGINLGGICAFSAFLVLFWHCLCGAREEEIAW